MTRRPQRPRQGQTKCHACKVEYLAGDEGWYKLRAGWLCSACRAKAAAKRRTDTGRRLLDNAKPLQSRTIDGKEYRVVQLPPKRR